ncbi:tagaturonate reductase [Jejuia spongiicola]|uniref:Tagaturonate reductase n=1 Tax=Jejuia spongiicola TaxID=2942207 RepID=A0ABT0QG83_9FLAO|nr:tagaturonate reductase [Jejuia spongiicola]MCL6294940.1 tagaturonate reductase [Jejuia spongiicola]
MKLLNRSEISTKLYPERILQFGQGNFLRAFANWMIHEMNHKANFDSGVVVIKPREKGSIETLNNQDGLYTLYLNGIKNGKATSEHTVIDCIQRAINPYKNHEDYLAIAKNSNLRFVISNTTEAGIIYNVKDKLNDTPQRSFPGKLTALLYKRFQFFEGAPEQGLIIIPCELIEKNGDNLKEIILQYAKDWNLDNAFAEWISKDNIFCNTLVDRIVSGYPKEKIDSITKTLGYRDELVVEGEQFYLWVIEGPECVKEELPAEICGLNVVFTNNLEPYRIRKVRILNGAHTVLVPIGYLYGINKVRESIEDKTIGKYLTETIFDEISPTLDLPEEELNQFANDVLNRFKNPYLEHELMSISLNSISKFKTRVLPSILEYIKRNNRLPKRLLFSLAALIAFYKGDRDGEKILLNDNQEVLEFFNRQWKTNDLSLIIKATLQNIGFWEVDLTQFDGFLETTTVNLEAIINKGMKTALDNLMD